MIILVYTRFTNLGWGLPYPMHPDERNMAVAIQQLSCPTNFNIQSIGECFNPHFFAYGQLPLYLAYGGIQAFHFINKTPAFQPTFEETTMALRIISALFSVLMVLLLEKIIVLVSKKNKERLSILTYLIFIFSPYAIQSSHFGTTESLLTFFFVAIIYCSLLFLKNKISPAQFVQIAGILSGLALGTKTSSLLFTMIPPLVIFLHYIFPLYAIGGADGGVPRHARSSSLRRSTDGEEGRGRIYRTVIQLVFFLCSYLCISLLFFIISSPQSILHSADFISSMNYESAVGLGTYLPFYTRQFTDTIPLLFQLIHVLPYVLGWPTLIASLLGFFLLPSWIGSFIVLQVARVKGTRQRAFFIPAEGYLDKKEHWWGKLRVTESAKYIDILRFALIISFLPPPFFFAKWTRFIAPSFPLFSLFAALFMIYILQKSPRIIAILCISIFILPGLAFLSIYTTPDVRFAASEWIYNNIPSNSKILSETANVVDIPILPPYDSPSSTHNNNYFVNSFNFYDLDQDKELQTALSRSVDQADYILVPSRRIFKNHSPESYPLLANYYDDLFSGRLGFEKVAEVSSYPRLSIGNKTLIEFPDEDAEETWTVFDHPVIRIYKHTTKKATSSPPVQFDFSGYKTIDYQLSGIHYRLLIADTPEKWEKGLMYVKSKKDIGGLDGMIFIFPDSQVRNFWNKNTVSDLTLYWIDDKKMVGTTELPAIGESNLVTTVTSPQNADTVIELMHE